MLLTSNVPTPLVQSGMYRAAKRARTEEPMSLAVQRLLKFIKLAKLFNTAPWADQFFSVNNDIFLRLTSSHLRLICGDEAQTERPKLLQILAAHRRLDGSGNLVWITNRQQGKTTTIGRFIALLGCTAVCGGLLCTIYSTSQDRSVELLKAVRQYLNWFKQHPEGKHIRFTRDCERMFVLWNGVVNNEIAARPKNVDSCRGVSSISLLVKTRQYCCALSARRYWLSAVFPIYFLC
tara:strand:+ start:137 stop:841 length:705 start_codon:yes stop_codon:yes gene_type:complete